MICPRAFVLGGIVLALCLSGCAPAGPPQVISVPTASTRPTALTPQPTPGPPRPQSGLQADVTIAVDLTDVRGTVNPLSGLQGGPLPVVRGDADLTEWYRAGGVDHVRLPQDTMPNNLTLGGIFPTLYGPADDARFYNFERIDRYVAAIVEAGATPLWQAAYDIGGGDSLAEGETGPQQGRLPTVPDQWGRIVQHTLMHFNDGWGEGHAWQVRYVEFTNEPFVLGGCQTDAFGVARCWEMFEVFAGAVSAYNDESGRDVQIVGPGNPVSVGELEVQMERLTALLNRLDPDQLDYLSFHPLGRTPLEQDAIAQELRRFLDSYGNGEFVHVRLWASQWTSEGPGQAESAARIAALDTATKILWQGTVDFATLYRGDRWPQGPVSAVDPETGEVDCDEATVCEESLYFTPDGEPKATFLPFLALAEMGRDTPQRVAVTNSDQQRVPALAGRSPDAGQVGVLIAAPNARSETYSVVLEGLPPGVSLRAERLVVDEASSAWEPRETIQVEAAANGTITLNGQFFGPSVVYWRLTAH